MLILKLLLIPIFVLCLWSCSLLVEKCVGDQDQIRGEIETKLNSALEVGDKMDKAESYLKAQGYSYSYSKYSQSLTGYDPNTANCSSAGTGFDIYISEQGEITKIEVKTSYTFL